MSDQMRKSNLSKESDSFLKIDNWVQTEPLNNPEFLQSVLHSSLSPRSQLKRDGLKTPFSSNDEAWKN